MGEDPNRIRLEIEQTRDEMGDTVDALSYKADVKGRAKDSLSSGKDAVAGQAKRATSVAQENPLGLAVGAIAVGFIAGMLVPATRVEDERIGPMADDVKDRAKQTGQEALERGKQVAQDAAETAKDSAQSHGEELRDSAREHAEQATAR